MRIHVVYRFIPERQAFTAETRNHPARALLVAEGETADEAREALIASAMAVEQEVANSTEVPDAEDIEL